MDDENPLGKPESITPGLDALLLALPGPARMKALQAGLGLSNGDLTLGTRLHPVAIPQMYSLDRRNDEAREAYARRTGVPIDEVHAALDPTVPAVG